jgi:hypothetical protein
MCIYSCISRHIESVGTFDSVILVYKPSGLPAAPCVGFREHCRGLADNPEARHSLANRVTARFLRKGFLAPCTLHLLVILILGWLDEIGSCAGACGSTLVQFPTSPGTQFFSITSTPLDFPIQYVHWVFRRGKSETIVKLQLTSTSCRG